jgi:hypothetical protein
MIFIRLAQVVCVVMVCVVVGAMLRGQQEVLAAAAPMFDPRLKMPPEIANLVRRSCADCHSEATRWPWYARFPPASILLERDVFDARQAMNLSRWSALTSRTAVGTLAAACSDVELRRMPLERYLWLHPAARMNAADVRQFCAWTRSESADLRRLSLHP